MTEKTRSQLHIYVTDEEEAWIRGACRELGVTRSYIVRLVIRRIAGLPLGPSGTDDYDHLIRTHVSELTPGRQ